MLFKVDKNPQPAVTFRKILDVKDPYSTKYILAGKNNGHFSPSFFLLSY
jgi:hypothetical protein